MNRPRLYRWLRIAVSAVCLAMVVGLSWLWVRSYGQTDLFNDGGFIVDSWHCHIAHTVFVEGLYRASSEFWFCSSDILWNHLDDNRALLVPCPSLGNTHNPLRT